MRHFRNGSFAYKNVTLRELLFADDKNVTPLLVAAANNYVDVAKRLLAMNCRVDVLGELKVERTSVRATPFRCALLKGHVAMARLLVLAGYTLHREPYVWHLCCCTKPGSKHRDSDDDDDEEENRNPARNRDRQRDGDSHREGDDDADAPPTVLQENEELRAWLVEHVRVPRALAEVARWHIRRLLGKPLRQRLDALPLPRAIKDYVLMKDLLE
jgi:ankyrin repeat protein